MPEYPYNEKNNKFTWLSSLYNPLKGYHLLKKKENSRQTLNLKLVRLILLKEWI